MYIDGFKYPCAQTMKLQPATLDQICQTQCQFMCQRLLTTDPLGNTNCDMRFYKNDKTTKTEKSQQNPQ